MRLYVVFVDGLGYQQLDEHWTAEAHWVHRLRNQLPSITAPNWASLLSGQRPTAHTVLDNDQVKHFGSRSTFLHDLAAQGRSVTVVSDWKPFRRLTPQLPFVHDRTPLRHLDRYHTDVVLVNLDRLDARAHKYGWNSRQAQITRRNLAHELAAFRQSLKDDYVMLVVADHGGFRLNHESPTNDAVREVPLLLYSNMKRVPQQPRIRTSTALRRWMVRHL